jgi:hypothetical protein
LHNNRNTENACLWGAMHSRWGAISVARGRESSEKTLQFLVNRHPSHEY